MLETLQGDTIFVLMDFAIHFDDQIGGVTIKIDNKPCDDLMPAEMNTQFIRADFVPQDCFGVSHVAAFSPYFRSLKMERCPKDRGAGHDVVFPW